MSVKEKYQFSMPLLVRDYEVDSQGIVNNANYLHYLEHTRHMFCIEAGTSFNDMAKRGLDPVVKKIAVEYINPLRPGDEMLSCLNLKREGARFVFCQDIYNAADETPIARAEVTIVCLENGRLSRGDELAAGFAKYL